jgi:hypothetical protein
MSIATEFSRLVFKRSVLPGVVPTIPTATTIDNTWLPTDLLVGEAFVNVVDDRFWFRTDNGIIEVALSGNSMYRYTTGATLVGSTIFFDRTDLASAYTVDLSSLVITGGTGGDFLPLTITAATEVNFSEDLLFSGSGSFTDYAIEFYGGSSDYSRHKFNLVQNSFEISDGTNQTYFYHSGDELTFVNDALAGGQDTSLTLGNRALIVSSFWTGFTGVRYQADYSANFTNRSLVDKEYVDGLAFSGVAGNYLALTGGTLTGPLTATSVFLTSVGSGTSIINLGLDSSGRIVTGTTGGSGNFLPLTGGTLTGPLVVNSNLTVTGNTVVKELTATTINVLNSGATIANITDHSSNTIKTGVTNSTIAAGSGNTINNDLRNVFVAGVNLTATTNDTAYFSNIVGAPYDLSVAISDETTALTSGATKLVVYAPRNFVVSKVKVSLSTSGSTTTTVDVNVGGSSILTSPISLTANTFVASTTAISSPSISEDNRITFDIDAAGSDAAGLKCYLIGKTS